MDNSNTKITHACQICGDQRVARLRPAIVVRPPVAEPIRDEVGRWSEDGWICLDDLQYRHKYIQHLVQTEKGELTTLEQEVIDSFKEHEILTRNPEEEFEAAATLGQRLADRIADFGGSWPFIAIFAVVLFSWMFVNSSVLIARPFDPCPYILLNLVLSCLAAIQAPVIMMSQNRQEARDRLHALHDY